MNITISDPNPKSADDVNAAYQNGYNQYPIDHPPVNTQTYYSEGYHDGFLAYPQQNPPPPPPAKTFLIKNITSVDIICVFTKPDGNVVNMDLPPGGATFFDMSHIDFTSGLMHLNFTSLGNNFVGHLVHLDSIGPLPADFLNGLAIYDLFTSDSSAFDVYVGNNSYSYSLLIMPGAVSR